MKFKSLFRRPKLFSDSSFSRLVYLLLILSAVNLLPTWSFAQEINLNLSVYYLAAQLSALSVALVLRRVPAFSLARSVKMLLLGLSIWYAMPIMKFYSFPVAHSADNFRDRDLILYYQNVWGQNGTYSNIREQILEVDADIVAINEYSEKAREELRLAEIYPYFTENVRDDNLGMAVFSKVPFEKVQDSAGVDVPPFQYLTIEPVPGRKTDFVLLHTLPPLGDDSLLTNKILLRRISTFLRHTEHEVITAGDFNATPYSGFYGSFTSASRVENAMGGFGLMRSWNALNPLARLTLDHVFYRGDFQIKNFSRLDSQGSDHFAYVVKFGF